MTAIRSWVRRGLSKDPVPSAIPTGSELDWLTKEICSMQEFTVLSGLDSIDPTQPAHPTSKKVVDVRSQLLRITGWNSQYRSTAQKLKQAIEGTFNFIYNAEVNDIRHELKSNYGIYIPFVWELNTDHSRDIAVIPLKLTLAESFRNQYEEGRPARWATDIDELESIISLWMHSLREQEALQDEAWEHDLNKKRIEDVKPLPLESHIFVFNNVLQSKSRNKPEEKWKYWLESGSSHRLFCLEEMTFSRPAQTGPAIYKKHRLSTAKSASPLPQMEVKFTKTVELGDRSAGSLAQRHVFGHIGSPSATGAPFTDRRTPFQPPNMLDQARANGEDIVCCLSLRNRGRIINHDIPETSMSLEPETLDEACAMDIYARFFRALVKHILEVRGITKLEVPGGPKQRLRGEIANTNTVLTQLSEVLIESGLFVTRTEALAHIVLPLMAVGKLPKPSTTPSFTLLDTWLKGPRS